MFSCKQRSLLRLKTQKYEVYKDPYHNIMRLNLYKFDGSPMNPMYLAYKPPQMLPTQTLNPTTASTTSGARSTATGGGKVKRGFGEDPPHVVVKEKTLIKRSEPVNADKWWWIGVGMTGVGSVLYFCF